MEFITASIRYNLWNLVNFSGRDTRGQFWPYVVVVYVLNSVLGMVIALPVFFESMAKFQNFAVAHPDQATITHGLGNYSISIEGYHPELMPDFPRFVLCITISAILFVVLISSSVVRRLRDRQTSPAIAIIPLIFMGFSLSLFPKLIDDFSLENGMPNLQLFFTVFLSNICYFGSALFLIVELAQSPKKKAQPTP